MKRLLFYTFIMFFFFSLMFSGCHRTPPAAHACDTEDLGLDTTSRYCYLGLDNNNNEIGLAEWKWGKKGDSLIIKCDPPLYEEDKVTYYYFLPDEGCIDYVKTSYFYMSDDIGLDENGNVIYGIEYEEYTESPFILQEYTPGIRLVCKVGPHEFWVEFRQDNWFDASHCGAPE